MPARERAHSLETGESSVHTAWWNPRWRDITTMWSSTTERVRVFRERHRAIDVLRHQRESGGSLTIYPGAVRALLQEIDLLQVVAQAAEQLAAFPCDESAGEAITRLRQSLRRWKE